jgi:uncharacterized RDD family membrane protein YckC
MNCPHCHRQVSTRAKNCSSCGGYIPTGQHLLEDAGIIEAALSTAAAGKPAALRKQDLPRVANLGDRFAAFALDSVALFGVFAVVDAWIFMRWGTVEGMELSLTTAALLLAVTLNAFVLFAYGWLLEASCGATLGKALIGIRVVKTGGRSALAASAIRNLMRVVDGLGFYLLGTLVASCSPSRQRLGDLCAGTAVVEEEFSISRKVLSLVLWIAVLFGAGWAVPRICSENEARVQSRYLNHVVVQAGRTADSSYFRIGRIRFDFQLASQTPPPAHL